MGTGRLWEKGLKFARIPHLSGTEVGGGEGGLIAEISTLLLVANIDTQPSVRHTYS